MNSQQLQRLINQGYQCVQQNDLARAYECFNKATRMMPDSFDAWLALGNLNLHANRIEEAVTALKKATRISPGNPIAHGQLGIAFYRLQHVDEAAACYIKVLEINPENIAAYANLAMVYLDSGRREDAISCCMKAIKINPEFAGAHLLLGSAYSNMGDYESAEKQYNSVLCLEPGNQAAVAGKADALHKLGHNKEAYSLLRKLIDDGSTDTSIITAFAAVSLDMGVVEEAVCVIEKHLALSGLTPMQQLQLHFSAGSLYDRLGDFDKAFMHYDTGNKLAQRKYDSEADKALFDNIISMFSSENMERLPRADVRSLTPVFIVGMPRSGTSLVERILGSHSKIFPAGELGAIPRLGECISNMNENRNRFPECVLDIDKQELERLSREHLEYLSDISGSSGIVTDKLPHNFLFLGLIELLFPGARIIHCKRDPLDTCLSNYFQYFSGPLDYPYDLSNIALHYNHYLRIMDHWKNTIQLPILEITYEELVCNQDSVTESLLSFLDLPLEDACLKFNESEYVTRTASYVQVREAIYTRSVGRWRHYEKHIGELIDNLTSNHASD